MKVEGQRLVLAWNSVNLHAFIVDYIVFKEKLLKIQHKWRTHDVTISFSVLSDSYFAMPFFWSSFSIAKSAFFKLMHEFDFTFLRNLLGKKRNDKNDFHIDFFIIVVEILRFVWHNFKTLFNSFDVFNYEF